MNARGNGPAIDRARAGHVTLGGFSD